MIFKYLGGTIVDSEKEEIKCVACGKVITTEQLEDGDYFPNGVCNPESGEDWCEPWCKNCAEAQEEYERDNGLRM